MNNKSTSGGYGSIGWFLVFFITGLTGILLPVPIIVSLMFLSIYEKKNWESIEERREIVLSIFYPFVAFILAFSILLMYEAPFLISLGTEGYNNVVASNDSLGNAVAGFIPIIFLFPFFFLFLGTRIWSNSKFSKYVKDALGIILIDNLFVEDLEKEDIK